MEFPNEHIIEDLYNSDLVTDIPSSQEYKDLLEEYNKLYDTIEDNNLRDKIEKLFTELNHEFGKMEPTKSEVVQIIKDYLPNFEHIETGKSLDSKM